MAASLGHWACVKVFAEATMPLKQQCSFVLPHAVHASIENENLIDVIQALLKAGANPNAYHIAGTKNYSLHEAVKIKNPRITALLLELGADQTYVDANKKTPALVAAEHGHWDSVKILVYCSKDIQDKCQFDKVFPLRKKKRSMRLK